MGFLVILGGMLCVAFILASHFFLCRFPALRYVPSVLLALAALGQIAAAGAARPADAVIHILLAMILGMVFLLTVLFTAVLPALSRPKAAPEDI